MMTMHASEQPLAEVKDVLDGSGGERRCEGERERSETHSTRQGTPRGWHILTHMMAHAVIRKKRKCVYAYSYAYMSHISAG